jgi:hypothetical protein
LKRALVVFGTVKAAAILKLFPRTTVCTHEVAKPRIDRFNEVLVASDVVATYHISDTCNHKHIRLIQYVI